MLCLLLLAVSSISVKVSNLASPVTCSTLNNINTPLFDLQISYLSAIIELIPKDPKTLSVKDLIPSNSSSHPLPRGAPSRVT